jgi:hypothetical protein
MTAFHISRKTINCARQYSVGHCPVALSINDILAWPYIAEVCPGRRLVRIFAIGKERACVAEIPMPERIAMFANMFDLCGSRLVAPADFDLDIPECMLR